MHSGVAPMADRERTHALDIPEILFLIGSFVPITDLKACALVSRRWHLTFASHYWWSVLMNFSALHAHKLIAHDEIKEVQLAELRQAEQDQATPEEEEQERQWTKGQGPRRKIDFAQENDRLDRVFYKDLCKTALDCARKMDVKISKEIVMESYLGLILLAGRRTNLRRLIFLKHYDVAEMDQRPVLVPVSVLTSNAAAILLGTSAEMTASTTPTLISTTSTSEANLEPSGPLGDKGEDSEGTESKFVKLWPMNQEPVDVVIDIVEQNRDLEVLRLGGFLRELVCQWTKRELSMEYLLRTRQNSLKRSLTTDDSLENPTPSTFAPFSLSSSSSATTTITSSSWPSWSDPSPKSPRLSQEPAQWPKLKTVHLQACTLHGDFLRILLLNAPLLERLWLQRITVDSASTTTLPSSAATSSSISQSTTMSEDIGQGSNTLESGAEEEDSSKLFILGTHVGTRLRTLGVCNMVGLPLWYQLRVAKQLPNLESLTLTIAKACNIDLTEPPFPPSSSPPSIASSMENTATMTFPSLHRLNLIFPLTEPPRRRYHNHALAQSPTITRIAHILASIPPTNLHHLAFCASHFQFGDFTKLIRLHSTWLQTIEIEDCQGFTGLELLKLLQSCPVLERLSAKDVKFEYFKSEYDLTLPWSCATTLKSLIWSLECTHVLERRICENVEAWTAVATADDVFGRYGREYGHGYGFGGGLPSPGGFVFGSGSGGGFHAGPNLTQFQIPQFLESQYQFFDRLATLTELETLDLICSIAGSSIDLSLMTGLERLASLKQLRELDVRTQEERVVREIKTDRERKQKERQWDHLYGHQGRLDYDLEAEEQDDEDEEQEESQRGAGGGGGESKLMLDFRMGSKFFQSRISRAATELEAKWMAREWPKLEKVRGLGFEENEQDGRYGVDLRKRYQY